MKTYKLRLDNKNIVVCQYEGKMPMQDVGIIDPPDNPLKSINEYLENFKNWKATEVVYPVKKEDVSKFIEIALKPFSNKPYKKFQDEIKTPLGVKIPSKNVVINNDMAMFYDTEKDTYIHIFRWLLGYTDFPIKKEKDGNFYWRKELRKKLLDIGIDIK